MEERPAPRPGGGRRQHPFLPPAPAPQLLVRGGRRRGHPGTEGDPHRARGHLRAGRKGAAALHLADDRGPGPGGRGGGDLRGLASPLRRPSPSRHPGRGPPARPARGLRGGRGPGGGGHGLRHCNHKAGGQDRRARRPLHRGRQAPGLRRRGHRDGSRALRGGGGGRRGGRPALRRRRPAGPGRARQRPRGGPLHHPLRRAGGAGPGGGRSAACRVAAPGCGAGGPGGLRGGGGGARPGRGHRAGEPHRAGARGASGAGALGLSRPGAQRRRRLPGSGLGRVGGGLLRRHQPRAAHQRGGALRLRPGAGGFRQEHQHRGLHPRPPKAGGGAHRELGPGGGGWRPTPGRCGCGSQTGIPSHERRTPGADSAQDRRDRHRPGPVHRRRWRVRVSTGVGFFDHMLTAFARPRTLRPSRSPARGTSR